MFSTLIFILLSSSVHAADNLPDNSPVNWVATASHDKKLETFLPHQFKKFLTDGIEAKSIGASCKFTFEQRTSEIPILETQNEKVLVKIHSQRVIPVCTLRDGLRVRVQPIECLYGQKSDVGSSHNGSVQFEKENVELNINISCTVTR